MALNGEKRIFGFGQARTKRNYNECDPIQLGQSNNHSQQQFAEENANGRPSRPRTTQPRAPNGPNPASRPMTASGRIGNEENQQRGNSAHNGQNRQKVNFGHQRHESEPSPAEETFLQRIARRSQSRSQSRGRFRSHSKGGHGSQSPRKFKPVPFKPPKVNDIELFDPSRQIQKGDKFEMIYREHEKAIVWQTADGEVERTKLESFCKKKKSFKDCGIFDETILRNIQMKKMENPTPIQKMVIPIIRNKRNDLLGHAPTGSGKTAAFLLPIISELISVVQSRGGIPNSDQPYVIIPMPTKELANQLFEDASAFALCTGVSVVRTCGHIPIYHSIRELNAGCDIFIATCGRLQQFVEEKKIKLDQLRYLVLDEADKLLQIDSFFNCIKLIKKNKDLNPEHRVLMFSATFSTKVKELASEILRPNRIRVQIGLENLPVETVKQKFIQVPRVATNKGDDLDKRETLRKFLMKDAIFQRDSETGKDYFKVPKTIVFMEKVRACYVCAISLSSQSNIRVQSLTSDTTLEKRFEKVASFATDKLDVLIATDLAARGLNFSGVEYVINLDLPMREGTQDEYIHRIGRTGRNGNLGHSISYFDPENEVDCKNAPYYVEKLEESGAEVPDWLRKIAEEQKEEKPTLDDVQQQPQKPMEAGNEGASSQQELDEDSSLYSINEPPKPESQNADSGEQKNKEDRVNKWIDSTLIWPKIPIISKAQSKISSSPNVDHQKYGETGCAFPKLNLFFLLFVPKIK